MTNALVDLDWEVKEEALRYFGDILQFLLNKHVNTKSVQELVQILKPYELIKAFKISLDDYDRRFLHRTYTILHKFHNYLAQNFCPDDLLHECSNDCNRSTKFPETEIEYEFLKPKEPYLNENGVRVIGNLI